MKEIIYSFIQKYFGRQQQTTSNIEL